MTFSDLRAIAPMLRSGNNDVLPNDRYSDSDLIELNYDLSILQLKNDLQKALNLDLTDTDSLDFLANKYTLDLQLALSYLQLINLYFQIDGGAGSKAERRFNEYKNRYEIYKSSLFSSMTFGETQKGTSSVRSVGLWL